MAFLFFLIFLWNYVSSSNALSFKSISSDTSNMMRRRSTTIGAFTVGKLWSGVWYSSLEMNVDTQNLTADGDFIWGSIYVGTGSRPCHWHGYWNANVEVDRHLNPNNVNWFSFNASLSSSFIASSYLTILEKNASGEIVGKYALNGLWQYNAGQSNSQSNVTAGLYTAIFDGTLVNLASVRIQYIATEHAGTLDLLDGIPVYPKAIETIFYINNWKYQSSSNYLSLLIGVGSASFSGNVDGQVKSGSGVDQVYFRVANNAFIDGQSKKVTITHSPSDLSGLLTLLESTTLETQLRARFGTQASVNVYEISFPANASNIIYDPTMGSGESPYDSSTKAWIIAVAVVAVFMVVVLLALGAAYMIYNRKSEYNRL